jgi:glycine dehydrogenase subunit 1
MGYIPHTDADRNEMLKTIGVNSIEELFHEVPMELRVQGELNVPEALDEYALTKALQAIGAKNTSLTSLISFLGAGIYEHYVPSLVMQLVTRGEFLTAYTPYQPEASQGYLQTIYEFQSLICKITGMEVANASMYDGATALAEACIMASGVTNRTRIVLSDSIHPHYRSCVETFSEPADCITSISKDPLADIDQETACVAVQYPDFFGRVRDLKPLVEAAHRQGALVVVVADPVALGVLVPPGDFGADVVVGEAQALGVPMGFGGPLVGYFSVKRELVRAIPGRIVGRTQDKNGRRGFVMTLRTREQDIRREKATSNICTNQALMALVATIWMCSLGKQGFRKLSETCIQKAHYAQRELCRIPGVKLLFDETFAYEFAIDVGRDAEYVRDQLLKEGILAGLPLGDYFPQHKTSMLIAVTEVRTKREIDQLVAAMATVVN